MDLLSLLRYSPVLVLCLSVSLLFLRNDFEQITPVVVPQPRRTFSLALLSLTALTYFLDGLSFIINVVLHKHWSNSIIIINSVLGLVAFGSLATIILWNEFRGIRRVWFLPRIKLVIATLFILDLVLTVLLAKQILSVYPRPHIIPFVIFLHLILPSVRVLLFLLLLAALLSPITTYSPLNSSPSVDHHPSASLLAPTPIQPLLNQTKYGTFNPSDHHSSSPTTRAPTPFGPAAKVVKPEISFEPSWSELWKRVKRLTPYLWPSKSPYLQFLASLCIFILLLARLVNLAMPFTLASLVRSLDSPSKHSPWPFLFLYVGLRYLQGSGGLPAARDTLWVPVMQFSDREMSQLSFDHLLDLSFAWHTRRKTGEILRVLDRGVAINRTFELILFNIIPTFIDISIALVAFCILFEWSLAIVIFLVMLTYVAASVVLTQYRTRIKRQMNERDILTRGIHTDCLLNYETVKYFGGEEYEGARYRAAIRDYQALEYKVVLSLNFLNIVQNTIISTGLLIGSIIVALRVTRGQSDAGDFVLFITYLAQLYGPLNQLGYIYRSVNTSLVDTEKLLDLLNEPTEVNDRPEAQALAVDDGEIEFDNVSFSYDNRTTALKNVSFKVPKNSSVALVGESGSGKSTILRLLYRFYDLKEGEGRILIDGRDIRDVTQKSLRQSIGVVPQDPILFNSSIAYNIGYGRFGASPEEIEGAAKSAQMHDKITTFPEGYETRVGERGVRLSGGEKQRVAIARTLLKDPPILLLDEATSALDTTTEKDIQKALQNLMNGRSSLSIAHRLSTIASADLILVLKDGQIVERGTHRELLALDGVFAAMWAEQISTSDEDSVMKGGNVGTGGGYMVDEPVTGGSSGMVPESSSSAFAPAVETGGGQELSVAEKRISQVPTAGSRVSFPTGDMDDSRVGGGSDGSISRGSGLQSILTRSVAPVPAPVFPEPVTFPSTGAESREQVMFPGHGHGVTFEDNVPVPQHVGGGSGSPDQPGRKRKTSQGLRGLARRLSLSKSPSSDDARGGSGEERVPTPLPHTPSHVTFDDTAGDSHTGTPDPGASGGEPKQRLRKTSQNLQKFARRLSVNTKRQSSSFMGSIPGLKRDKGDKDRDSKERDRESGGSTDEGGGGSGQLQESPAGSVRGLGIASAVSGIGKSRKDRKEKA